MNPIDISFTESVQGAGGAGFSAPIFRAGVGIDQGNATPQSRAGRETDYLAGIDMNDLDPVSSMRESFDQDVSDLYDWVASVVEKGYDPTRMDMSDPNSKKVWLEFNKKKQGLKTKADNLRESNLLKRDKSALIDPTADLTTARETAIRPNFAALVAEGNKVVSSAGINDEEAFGVALMDYEQRGEQLMNAYMQQRAILKDSPAMQTLLDAEYSAALAARQKPYFKGMTDYQMQKLRIDEMRLGLAIENAKRGAEDDVQFNVANKSNAVVLPDGKTNIVYETAILTTPEVSFSSAEGWALEKDSKLGANKYALKKKMVTNGKVDKYEILAVDANGLPIIEGAANVNNSGKIAGYKVFAVGQGKSGGDDYPIWTDISVGRNKYKSGQNRTFDANISALENLAKEMTGQIGKSKATQSAPAATQPSTSTQFRGVPQGGFN
jgi:hypothetical protein